MSPAQLFAKKDADMWLESAVKSTMEPRDLLERNWLQLLLVERYQRQFGGTKLEALRKVADAFALHFPH